MPLRLWGIGCLRTGKNYGKGAKYGIGRGSSTTIHATDLWALHGCVPICPIGGAWIHGGGWTAPTIIW